tara:strand:+ start:166 stop:615 length:450 start_codon:yes stop_codon:yes gene_type:complete
MDKQKKRISRCICLQSLYAKEMSNISEEKILNHFYEKNNEIYEDVSKSQIEYAENLLKICISNKGHIDKIINKKLKNWDMSRLALVDKLILRMSISEMLFIDDVPPKVSIAEGVEIAKEFSTNNSSRFVNGILDVVYNNIDEFIIKENN